MCGAEQPRILQIEGFSQYIRQLGGGAVGRHSSDMTGRRDTR